MKSLGMADDTEISDCVTNNLTEAVTEQSSKLLDNNLEFKNSSENNDGTASTPSSVHSQGETSYRASPDPSCSICLGKLQNKSFTDNCYHPFCFACLLKWSKVKAVCPLCKVEFKSIVHNVRSNDDYDQYYVERAPSVHPTWFTSDSMEFRYTTTMSIRQREYPLSVSSFQYAQHRHTYASHSVTVDPLYTVNREQSPGLEGPRNIQFRKRVYSENLWAKQISQRVRRATPSYYYANQACTHRLVPWLTREVMALMSEGDEQRVDFVLDYMMSLILRHDILSRDFFMHMQAFFADYTEHFVHEFYSYAISIHDMNRYDELVRYERRYKSSSPSSSESESDVTTTVVSGSDEGEYPVPVDISIRPSMVSPHKSPYSEDFSQPSSSMAGVESMPSTSRVGSTRPSPISIYPIVTLSSGEEENEYVEVCYNDEDDEECVILQELKPRCLRTPEVLELSSDSERAVSPTLPGLEPVSDGSFDTVEEGFAETAPSFPDNSSPIVINVLDSSQTPLQDESPYIPPYLSYIERPYKRRVTRKPKRPERSLCPLRSPSRELRWSSSRSKERHCRSGSPERNLSFNKKFSHDRGLSFSESLEFGESSPSLQMLDTNTLFGRDHHYSSSKSPSLKKLKVRSIVKRSTQRSLSNSSNNSAPNKKHKSKKRKRKKGEKHKHREY